MGSYALTRTTSTAADNRQAATDSAIVQRGGLLALGGNVFNLSAAANASSSTRGGGGTTANAKSAGAGEARGGSIELNVLDGGAIDKSFDFAAFSLSEVLSAFVNQTREQTQATTNTLGTIGEAISNAATTTQQASQEAAENNKNMQFVIIGGVALAAWWFLFKGKK